MHQTTSFEFLTSNTLFLNVAYYNLYYFRDYYQSNNNIPDRKYIQNKSSYSKLVESWLIACRNSSNSISSCTIFDVRYYQITNLEQTSEQSPYILLLRLANSHLFSLTIDQQRHNTEWLRRARHIKRIFLRCSPLYPRFPVGTTIISTAIISSTILLPQATTMP